MPEIKILIVEDERVVAEDLKRLVQKMGYAVTGIAASGEEALAKARADKPDLVLMDIRIQGPQDGIETAELLYAELEVPVSYLTAYADAPTLERAKATMPYGYILKPFDARSLQTVIELALHRRQMERVLPRLDGWPARALNGFAEAVIAADARGRVTFMNKAAEALTGRTPDALFGKLLTDILPADGKAQASGKIAGTLAPKDGPLLSILYTRTPLPGEDGEPEGSLIVIKEAGATEAKR